MNDNIVRRLFLLLLGLTYIGLGIFIYFKKVIVSPWGEILAIMFFAYGSWRVYRSVTSTNAQ
jgi:hypothetical protein